MAIETKTIANISELKVGEKSKKPYFVIDFTDSTKAVCYNPAMYKEVEVGKTQTLDINPPQKEGYSPQLVKVIKAEDLPAPVTPKPILSPPEISPQEIGMWWKEVGENLRSGYWKDSPIREGIKIAYHARMFHVLRINPQELKGETKTAPPSKSATAGTKPATKETGTIPFGKESEGEV